MKKNIHQTERFFRVLIGVVLVSFAFFGPKNYWFLLGLIPIVTGLVGFCPIYRIFSFSTRPPETEATKAPETKPIDTTSKPGTMQPSKA